MRAVSIVTLGVRDLALSSDFYRSLGFEMSTKSSEDIVWFRTGGTVLGLYPWDALADDVGVPPHSSGFRGVTLAMNMVSKEAVEHMIEKARTTGATIVKEPQDVFWGGYSSYFQDPDGHLWEVAWNPFTPVDEMGNLDME